MSFQDTSGLHIYTINYFKLVSYAGDWSKKKRILLAMIFSSFNYYLLFRKLMKAGLKKEMRAALWCARSIAKQRAGQMKPRQLRVMSFNFCRSSSKRIFKDSASFASFFMCSSSVAESILSHLLDNTEEFLNTRPRVLANKWFPIHWNMLTLHTYTYTCTYQVCRETRVHYCDGSHVLQIKIICQSQPRAVNRYFLIVGL